MQTPYYEQVVQQLRQSPVMARHGFRPEDINWYGKGANHHDLMVITKPGWTVAWPEKVEGYTGVNVHLESDTPGSLLVHCELCPRQESESKADQARIAGLLQLKGRIATKLREQIVPCRLERFNVNLSRVRKDPADPASLKVMGFDIGLPKEHAPAQFASAVQPILDAVAGMIDGVLAEISPKATGNPCPACGGPVPGSARFCPKCGHRTGAGLSGKVMLGLLVAALVVSLAFMWAALR